MGIRLFRVARKNDVATVANDVYEPGIASQCLQNRFNIVDVAWSLLTPRVAAKKPPELRELPMNPLEVRRRNATGWRPVGTGAK